MKELRDKQEIPMGRQANAFRRTMAGWRILIVWWLFASVSTTQACFTDCGDCGYWDEELQMCVAYPGNQCAVDDNCGEHYSCNDNCVCECTGAPYYTKNGYIYPPVSILSPSYEATVPVSTQISVECTSWSQDPDCWHHCKEGVWVDDDIEYDTVTYKWSGPGTFNPDNQPSCTWTTPSSSGPATINVKVDDAPLPGADDDEIGHHMDVTVVKVDKIQYNDPVLGYTDVSGTLYVLIGSTVTFQAIPSPAEAAWPNGKPVWGGTSEATGPTVTFNTASQSSTDYKTVTAECGNTVTVNVVVFEVELTSPPSGTTFYIDHDTMQIEPPGISCEVKALAGTDDITGSVALTTNWALLLSWTGGGTTYYTPGPTSNDKLTSSANPFNGAASTFTTGGNVSISVSGTAENWSYGLLSSAASIKIDEDPSNDDFASELGSDIIKAMAWKEWAGSPTEQWNQYAAGIPIEHNGDWGVMQVNKGVWSVWLAREYDDDYKPHGYTVCRWTKMAWNWKTNIANGKYIHGTYLPYKYNASWTPANEEERAYTYAFGYTYGEVVMNARSSYADLLAYDAAHKNYLSTAEPGVRWAFVNKPWEN